jgi:cystathionine beta-lyase
MTACGRGQRSPGAGTDNHRVNEGRFRAPNPPIWRTSTVLFDDIAHLERVRGRWVVGDPDASTYGTYLTPTTAELCRLLEAGEGGTVAALAPSGLAAISTALLAIVRPGDHILVVDAAYGPVRQLCDGVLARLGVVTEFYDPLVGAGIAALIRPETSVIWMESPGTNTFEIDDVPAIVAAARAADHRVVTMFDNTWGSPGIFRPFDHGVDLSIVALTKYWGGHADLLAGAVFATGEMESVVRQTGWDLGVCTNGEDAFLLLRGARTAALRIRAHEANALEIARRLADHPRVGRVLHPALPDHPGHGLWRRDFHGSSGLFAFELLAADGGPAAPAEATLVVDRLAAGGLFGIGYSWGGYESLVMPVAQFDISRSVRPWVGGELIRLHTGLEPVDAQWAELERALADG